MIDNDPNRTFDIRSCRDLCLKLEREFARLQTETDREHLTDHTLNFALTAWHLIDWVREARERGILEFRQELAAAADQWPPGGQGRTAFREYVCTQCPHLAEQGDPRAQYYMAMITRDDDESWRWACLAANQGQNGAQVRVGSLEQDVSKTFMWYSLATSNGHPTASVFRDELAKKMTPDQIAEAERLAREWKPDPASCEIGNSPV